MFSVIVTRSRINIINRTGKIVFLKIFYIHPLGCSFVSMLWGYVLMGPDDDSVASDPVGIEYNWSNNIGVFALKGGSFELHIQFE